jgi:Domain of unknown function (DUF397)
LLTEQWHTSTRSNDTNCVEVRARRDHVEVRDSKDREGDSLVVSAIAWEAFVAAVKDGEFDR